uniref:Uncharacterized protein n=1 Tax=Anguilla anguilla TaxID=7936 RepID=A0A0E9PQM8_ANGAN
MWTSQWRVQTVPGEELKSVKSKFPVKDCFHAFLD